MEIYLERKGTSPRSARLSDTHEEGSQVQKQASEDCLTMTSDGSKARGGGEGEQ